MCLSNSAFASSFLRPLVVATAVAGLTLPAHAQDWAKTSDESLRHHLEFFVDARGSEALTTTWPFVPSNLLEELHTIDRSGLSPAENRSVDAMLTSLEGFPSVSASVLLGTERQELRGFANDHRGSNEIRVSVATRQNNFLGRLTVSSVDDPVDSHTYQLDNSYVAVDWKNWRFGAGSIDRWWGPGWQSSLILSNNARPSPGIFVTRNTSERSELPIARYLGPWNLTLFANQLESNRHVPKAKLLGGRFAFKPIASLEIGLSRTAQWGGEGRPENWDSLVDLILGHDNVGSDDIDRSNEPGNQLGGIDVRWSSRIGGKSFALYGQLIGEDEAGGLPSRKIGMIGIETPIITDWTHGRLFIEASDTTMDFLDDKMFNGAYEHSVYRNGYRYNGRVIGASSDNDSRLLAIGGFHEFGKRNSITWKALYASLNRDGVAAGNTIAPAAVDTAMISAAYARRISEAATVELHGFYMTDEIAPNTGLSKAGIQLGVTLSK